MRYWPFFITFILLATHLQPAHAVEVWGVFYGTGGNQVYSNPLGSGDAALRSFGGGGELKIGPRPNGRLNFSVGLGYEGTAQFGATDQSNLSGVSHRIEGGIDFTNAPFYLGFGGGVAILDVTADSGTGYALTLPEGRMRSGIIAPLGNGKIAFFQFGFSHHVGFASVDAVGGASGRFFHQTEFQMRLNFRLYGRD